MKPVNLMAGRPAVAWDLLFFLALDPSSLIYWPELFMLDFCDKSGCGTPPSGLGPFTDHLFLKHSWWMFIRGKFLNIQYQHFAILLSTHFISRVPPVYKLWSIKSRQVYCCVFLTAGRSAGAVLNASWLCWPHFSSAEQNTALPFWCLKGLHRPFPGGSIRVSPSFPQQGGSGVCNQSRFPNAMVRIRGY